jgi:arylsulfatase
MKGVDDIEWDFWTGNRPWWQLEALEYLYDGGIHQADHQIGRILDELAAAGTLDETLVVVTSDHGEGFGEVDPTRGFRSAGHLHGTSEIHYHVPLVIKYPGQSSREDIDDLVTLSQFPAAVEIVLEERGSPASFIPEGSVVTYATGADIGAASDEKIQFKREKFEGQIMIAYTAAGDRVEKSIRWGDDEATVEIQDVQQTMKVSETAGEGLTAFDELSDQDVRMEASEEAYDESTQEFLEQMGYV